MKALLINILIVLIMTMEGVVAQNTEKITFGAGCFWCVEATFLQIKGVDKVVSGYMGGTKSKPTYKEVCTGLTGYAEVVQVIYNPDKVSFTELLQVFFVVHDPTTLNRQGSDVGTQYRSAIFYHVQEQREEAEKAIEKLNISGIYDSPIVTEITEYSEFYPAEDYHNDYYNNNKSQPYCSIVITPKLRKVEKELKEFLKNRVTHRCVFFLFYYFCKFFLF